MRTIGLAEVDPAAVPLVGAKAAGLAAMIHAGERVPDGFCLTTEAYRHGVLPTDELARAYAGLGGGRVAVRSSATVEDLPHASAAGQYETVLGVIGLPALTAAIRRCWASLHSSRAVAYRKANGTGVAHMAVVVQRMVEPSVAGVLFTANPLTGRRTEMVVGAAPGMGAGVVDGTVAADHYVLHQDGGIDSPGGCLAPGQLAQLRTVGCRLQEQFGHPQDVEWAVDQDGVLWLLQSRQVTALFPAPPTSGRPGPRVYVELGGQLQGVLRPFTPMGSATLRALVPLVAQGLRLAPDPFEGSRLIDLAGRLYLDLTDAVRTHGARLWLPRLVAVALGPRAAAAIVQVLDDPRFAPLPRRMLPAGTGLAGLPRAAPRALAGIGCALARPAAARARALGAAEQFRRWAATPPSAADVVLDEGQLGAAGGVQLPPAAMAGMVWPLAAGVLAAAVSGALLRGIASESEVHTVLGGMPHNVTLEMDLAIWRIAAKAGTCRELLRDTPPATLAARYRAGALPDVGLAEFLDRYGHRAAVEIDVGIPRWDEDPAPVFAAIANCLRIADPQQAPDRRFSQAADRAEVTLHRLVRRARSTRSVRALLAGLLLRRSRELAGLRELGKFAGLHLLREIRRELLVVGAGLARRDLLASASDVMFLDPAQLQAAINTRTDHHDLVAARRADYERELRRRHVPVALLSDGTDVEATRPATAPVRSDEHNQPALADNAGSECLHGTAAAPGTATGPARVVYDPTTARIEPGEILITPTTDPGWTPLFMTAGGLVTEVGTPLAHGPTLAREYGIPAAVCVPNATTVIRTGQLVTINGAAGTVNVGC